MNMGGNDARAWLASRQHGKSGYLTIDLGALARNYDQLSSVVAPAKAAAVVKADAYGLGARQVANALYERGCRDFFVAQFPEALILREFIADDADLYVLNGLQPGDEVTCAEANSVPVINSLPGRVMPEPFPTKSSPASEVAITGNIADLARS